MNKQIQKIFIDLSLWSLALPVSFLLRLEFGIAGHAYDIALATILFIPVKAAVMYALGFHLQSWHKISVWDLFRIIQGVSIAGMVIFGIVFLTDSWMFLPKTVPVIEVIIAVLLLSGVRLASRMHHERDKRAGVRKSNSPVERVLIAGAGEAGTMLAREVKRHPDSHLHVVGFLDDLPSKQKEWFMGLPVFGSLDKLGKVVEKHDIDKVIIAMPTAPGSVIRRVISLALSAHVDYQIMPGLYELLSGKFKFSQIRDVNLEDLLRRKPVELDMEPIADYIEGKTILVTGAGGSIGSEIVRQIMLFSPVHILLLGRGENSIYEFERECLSEYGNDGTKFTALITDVRDYDTLEHHFAEYKPDVVFHAAAHKHVPLMESNPDQAIKNNVGGTRNLVQLALKYKVSRFVNISSDKSVNPTSVMGASKRVAEFIVSWASCQASPGQAFVSVRFGNVLGSRGSVVPLFKKQIREGGPITITHPEMTRYFMTIPEASQLVLQAGGLGGNGSVYVLDMGQPVKISDLANDLIRLSGFLPGEDIKIKYSGIRPGEKLFEELLTAEEGTNATHHSKIFSAKTTGLPSERFEDMIQELFDVAQTRDGAEIRRYLKKIIPTCNFNSFSESNSKDSGMEVLTEVIKVGSLNVEDILSKGLTNGHSNGNGNGHTNGKTNGHTNGLTNGHSEDDPDEN